MPRRSTKSIAVVLQIVLGLVLAAILGLLSGLLTGDLKFIVWINAQQWYSPWNAAWAAIAVAAAMILVAIWKNSDADNPRNYLPTRQDLDAALRKALEGFAATALESGWVPPQILKNKEAEIAKLTDQLRSFQRQLASSFDSAEARLSQCLEVGDLDTALREASEQVENRHKEAGKLPRDLYVLGTIHELRFEWPQALTVYHRAWQLGKDPDHGLKYAHFEEIFNHFNEAITAYEALLSISAGPAQRAAALNSLGLLYRETQRMKEAEEAYAEAFATYRKLAQANPAAWLPDVAATLNNLAALYYATERMKQAEDAYAEALETYRKLVQANPVAYRPGVAMTLNSLAILYRDTQRMKQAEEAYVEALETYRKLAQANPGAYLPKVTTTLNNLANLSLSTERVQQAETYASEAERILDPLWQANPELHGDQMARTLATRALVSEAGRQPAAEACALARRAFAAACDPALDQSIQKIIDRLCPASQGGQKASADLPAPPQAP